MQTNTFMIFNGIDFSDYLTVESVDRGFMPSISNTYVKKYHRRSEINPTSIKVSVRLIQDTDEELTELKRLLAGMLFTTEPKKLILYDDPTRYDLVALDGGTSLERLWTTGRTTLTFINGEGVSYSNIPRTENISTINVGGTWKTRPIFEMTVGSLVSEVRVTNVTTGKLVTVKSVFQVGNKVIIDCQKEIVTVNGNPIMGKVSLQSDFFDLIPGANQLSYTVPGTVKFNEAWL